MYNTQLFIKDHSDEQILLDFIIIIDYYSWLLFSMLLRFYILPEDDIHQFPGITEDILVSFELPSALSTLYNLNLNKLNIFTHSGLARSHFDGKT